jgi:hypothetical protein
MSLATLKTDLLAFEATLVSPYKPSPILRAAAPILVDAADILDLFMATPDSDPDKVACCECLKRISAKAKEPATMAAVGAWGDGTFLKLLLQFLATILPLVLNPTPPAP